MCFGIYSMNYSTGVLQVIIVWEMEFIAGTIINILLSLFTESGSKLSHLISKGEALRDEIVHLLESRDEVRKPETTTIPAPPIDPIIGK